MFVTREITTVCVSKDGLEVEATVSFQYRPNLDHLVAITQNYTDSSTFDDIIIVSATSAIHHSCGDFEVAEFQSRRFEVQERQKLYMEVRLACHRFCSQSSIQMPEPGNRKIMLLGVGQKYFFEVG